MKFRVRDENRKGDFDIQQFRWEEARTRSFIAKCVTVSGLLLLGFCAAHAAASGNENELHIIVSSTTMLMGFVLGRYFSKNRDE